MPSVIIRPYRGEDRPYVREICCDAADQGEPVERFFADREVAADLLTAYYTDYEPSSILIADVDGRVAGYVLGCLDNRRYGLVLTWLLLPKIIVKAFKRGLFFQRPVWVMAGTMTGNWRRLVSWRKESFHSHQAHMHIGIARNFRRQHVGEKLARAFIEYASGEGVEEIAASVHSANAPGSRFFQHLGFDLRDRYPMVMSRNQVVEQYHSLLYVKKIA